MQHEPWFERSKDLSFEKGSLPLLVTPSNTTNAWLEPYGNLSTSFHFLFYFTHRGIPLHYGQLIKLDFFF